MISFAKRLCLNRLTCTSDKVRNAWLCWASKSNPQCPMASACSLAPERRSGDQSHPERWKSTRNAISAPPRPSSPICVCQNATADGIEHIRSSQKTPANRRRYVGVESVGRRRVLGRISTAKVTQCCPSRAPNNDPSSRGRFVCRHHDV